MGKPGEVLVKNRAIAINHIDWLRQTLDYSSSSGLQFLAATLHAKLSRLAKALPTSSRLNVSLRMAPVLGLGSRKTRAFRDMLLSRQVAPALSPTA